MVQQGPTEAPSKRFIRAYLVIWAVPAIGALGYLASLAWQPEQPGAASTQTKVAEPDPALKAATKALAEIGTIRQNLDDLHKDMGGLRETAEQRSEYEKALQARLAALEEKVAALPSAVVTTVTTPTTGKQKTVDKGQQKAAALKPGQLKSGSARVITVDPTATPDKTGSAPNETPIETGSIAQAEVVFGEPVVTRAGELYAVQLDVAPSLDGLRMRWSLLLERYGSTLATLQPRFVPPRTPGAPYRLLAGPLTSLADARTICGEVRAQLPACSTTDFIGDPL